MSPLGRHCDSGSAKRSRCVQHIQRCPCMYVHAATRPYIQIYKTCADLYGRGCMLNDAHGLAVVVAVQACKLASTTTPCWCHSIMLCMLMLRGALLFVLNFHVCTHEVSLFHDSVWASCSRMNAQGKEMQYLLYCNVVCIHVRGGCQLPDTHPIEGLSPTSTCQHRRPVRLVCAIQQRTAMGRMIVLKDCCRYIHTYICRLLHPCIRGGDV